METDLQSFIKVSSAITASLCYCYYLVSRIPKGLTRLISLLPILTLFTLLPFSLHTFHIGAPTAFSILWLANFKLLLFTFDLGPLSSHPPKSLTRFLATASLPINLRRPTLLHSSSSSSSALAVLTKLILSASIIYLYQLDYKRILHPDLVLLIYCVYMYLGVETILAVAVLPVKAFLGDQSELDPQFDEPYLSTSLQDFWGRRWNLMVPTILRPTVYDPVRLALVPMGRRLASVVATVAAFGVSGLMHELIWFYFTRASPTWEVTCFFVLHGVCTAGETAAKRAVGGRVKVPRAVSGPLTLGFLALTAKWLFFPQLLRNGVDERAISEYAPLVQFLRKTINS